MQIVGFTSSADLVGRRVRIRWEFVPDAGESVASIPHVTVRRKLRDFDFPAPAPPAPDPFVVYASASFLAGPHKVTELADWETFADDGSGERTAWSALSLSQAVPAPGAAREVEVVRRSIGVVYGADGVPLRQIVELIDLGTGLGAGTGLGTGPGGGAPGGLLPGQVYYYQIFTDALADIDDPSPYRATALVTERYSHGRTLYEMLPEIYRRHDVQLRPEEPGTATVPEMARRAGQLRRLVELFGSGVDFLRSSAEGLRTLHDLDQVDARALPLLADHIGWSLSYDVEIPLQRNELKTASLLYRGVGTVPNIRALVNHYTGWFSQIAEFGQHLLRANEAAQYNIFWNIAEGAGWRGAYDASAALGFGPGNRTATGGAQPAALLGTIAEPFALRAGMELTLAADSDLPAAVRLLPGDFADIARATAYEVARVLNRSFYEITATAENGRLRVRSNSVGTESAISIIPPTTSLLSLESAPSGRLCPFVDRQRAIRLFYDAVLPRSGDAGPGLRQVRYKTFTGGAWRNARGLDPAGTPPARPQGSPAAVELPGGRILLAYLESPDTPDSALRLALGTPAAPEPARLLSARRGPFALVDGAVLALTGSFGSETFRIRAGDFANLAKARASEVAHALNTQLSFVRGSDPGDGSLALATTAAGPDVRLAVDFRQSTAARALGFDRRSSSATGSWDDAITWQRVAYGPTEPSRIADLCAVSDGAQGAWLFYAAHAGGLWRIMGLRCDAQGATGAPLELADGGLANREPCAVVTDTGAIAVFWSRRDSPDATDDAWHLRMRVLPAGGAWQPETSPYALATNDRFRDREPGALRIPGQGVRVWFRSNRLGGQSLWSITLPQDLSGTAVPALVTPDDPSNDAWPAPLALGGETMLFWRSDRNVSLAQVGVDAGRSVRVPDLATVRRFAGSVTAAPRDLLRNRGIRLWGDLHAYTPQEPQQPDTRKLTDSEFYTPNTIGLYVSRGRYGSPLTPDEAKRVRQLLANFLPVHLRAILIVVAGSDVEYVYNYEKASGGGSAIIREAWADRHPFLDSYGGAEDRTAVVANGWVVLRSNSLEHQSGDPARPETLRHRTFYPPLK